MDTALISHSMLVTVLFKLLTVVYKCSFGDRWKGKRRREVWQYKNGKREWSYCVCNKVKGNVEKAFWLFNELEGRV